MTENILSDRRDLMLAEFERRRKVCVVKLLLRVLLNTHLANLIIMDDLFRTHWLCGVGVLTTSSSTHSSCAFNSDATHSCAMALPYFGGIF